MSSVKNFYNQGSKKVRCPSDIGTKNKATKNSYIWHILNPNVVLCPRVQTRNPKRICIKMGFHLDLVTL